MWKQNLWQLSYFFGDCYVWIRRDWCFRSWGKVCGSTKTLLVFIVEVICMGSIRDPTSISFVDSSLKSAAQFFYSHGVERHNGIQKVFNHSLRK